MENPNDSSELSPVERLLAIEEVRLLKARYFRFLDTKDENSLASVFASDATLDMSEGSGGAADPSAVIHGAEQIARFILSALKGATTVHQGSMPEIAVLTGNRAMAVWAMHDLLQWNEQSSMPFQRLVGYGHYQDSYRCIGGRWFIETSKLTRLKVEVS
ncbi:SnoaL-like protein [Paraburkholderia sp. BL18I3N2]|uniref:nuclear transport factor 2 family protein n=1 Tax=Paraburkholderia sp. BL18I3N2 TaxID=1938799 RepID=UPI000D06FA44|nr:nuclear transport factor 2 family protein [Paraburkholderia sp. BL18I3N2]PRX27340.1 SnoaL-like protein [Paraburkholderia sp. BL18I3N2]